MPKIGRPRVIVKTFFGRKKYGHGAQKTNLECSMMVMVHLL